MQHVEADACGEQVVLGVCGGHEDRQGVRVVVGEWDSGAAVGEKGGGLCEKRSGGEHCGEYGRGETEDVGGHAEEPGPGGGWCKEYVPVRSEYRDVGIKCGGSHCCGERRGELSMMCWQVGLPCVPLQLVAISECMK